ncbi:MAG: hypothetical protein LH654_11875 [Thermoleophilia bacterium]|nr:hypothetical protein [Thermoleophilia bacterium]
MRVLASIAVIPVLFVGWQLWSDHSFEQRLAPIASGIAGRSVEVNCQSLWGSLLDAKGREGEVYAILILAHESYHTAGSRDEAETNCFAIQAMAWTATELGAPQDEAELLALAMEALEPGQGTDYGTNGCHGGERLDLHPETPEFGTEFPVVPPGGLGRFARQ